MRFIATGAALALVPAAAMAGTMPQMDVHNPLTGTQVIWMVVILLVLYFTLSRWGLPEIGKVLEVRDGVIKRDLAAARAAKTAADQAVAHMNALMLQARQKAQADVAEMIAKAKARAAANAATLAARLDKNLAESEARIALARAAALAAIKPVAEDAASSMLVKLTGQAPEAGLLSQSVEQARSLQGAV